MSIQRLVIPSDLDNRLRYLTGRTGLTANLLCRCAFCLSLNEPGIPDLVLSGGGIGEGQGREMNRYTLLGEYDLFFFALLRERLQLDELSLDDETLEQQFKAHLFRGIGLLAGRIKSLEDLADLVAQAALPPDIDELITSPRENPPRDGHLAAQEAGGGNEQPSTEERGPLVPSDLLMHQTSAPTLWEQPPASLEIAPGTAKPRLTLALANDAETRLANAMVTRYHYLHSPVDARCSLLAYLVLLGGQRVGVLIFGRPEATRTGDWYGDVADKDAGKCRFSRWEILNLARIWLDPVVQEGGAWHSHDLIPGFYDRQQIFHSRLATTVVEMALECVVIDYLIAFPPVDTSEPYAITEVLSYCDTAHHKGTVYQQSGFRLERVNQQGIQTYARPVRSLTYGEDAYICYLAEHSQRSKRYRAQRAGTGWHQEQLLPFS